MGAITDTAAIVFFQNSARVNVPDVLVHYLLNATIVRLLMVLTLWEKQLCSDICWLELHAFYPDAFKGSISHGTRSSLMEIPLDCVKIVIKAASLVLVQTLLTVCHAIQGMNTMALLTHALVAMLLEGSLPMQNCNARKSAVMDFSLFFNVMMVT